MISLKHRFVFLHVPKTGGSSVAESLGRYAEGELVQHELRRQDLFRVEGGPFSDLAKHATYQDHALALQREGYDIRDFKVASVIRNPWDTAVSLYFFRRETGGVPASEPTSREGLVDSIRRIRRWTEFWSARPVLWRRSNRIEVAIRRRTGLPAQIPVEAITGSGLTDRIDTVLRFENLNEDYLTFCREIGLKGARPLKVRNRTNRGSYQQYFDEELKQMVVDRFWREIDCFKYEF